MTTASQTIQPLQNLSNEQALSLGSFYQIVYKAKLDLFKDSLGEGYHDEIIFFEKFIEKLRENIPFPEKGTEKEIKDFFKEKMQLDEKYFSHLYATSQNQYALNRDRDEWVIKELSDNDYICFLLEILESKSLIKGYAHIYFPVKNTKEKRTVNFGISHAIVGNVIVVYDKIYKRNEGEANYNTLETISELITEIRNMKLEDITAIIMSAKQLLPSMIHHSEEFNELLRYLTVSQRQIVIDALEEELPRLYFLSNENPTKAYKEISEYLSPKQRSNFFAKIKGLIKAHFQTSKTAEDGLLNLNALLYYTNSKERAEIIEAIPNERFFTLIKNTPLNLVELFSLLPAYQRKRVFISIQFHSSELEEFFAQDVIKESINEWMAYLSPEQKDYIKSLKCIKEYFKNNPDEDSKDINWEMPSIDDRRNCQKAYLRLIDLYSRGELDWKEIGKFFKHYLNKDDIELGDQLLRNIGEKKEKLINISKIEYLPRVLHRLNRKQRNIAFESIHQNLQIMTNKNVELISNILRYFTTDQIHQFYIENHNFFKVCVQGDDIDETCAALRYLSVEDSKELLESWLPLNLTPWQIKKLMEELPYQEQKTIIREKFRPTNAVVVNESIPLGNTKFDELEEIIQIEDKNERSNRVMKKLDEVISYSNGIQDNRALELRLWFAALEKPEKDKISSAIEKQLPEMIHCLTDLKNIIEFLSPEQRSEIFNLVEGNILALIKKDFISGHWHCLEDLGQLLDEEQKNNVYPVLRDYWHEIIDVGNVREKPYRDGVMQFYHSAFQIMTAEQKEEFFYFHKNRLLHSVETAHHLTLVLDSISDPAQILTIYENLDHRLFNILKRRDNKEIPDPLFKHQRRDYADKLRHTTGVKLGRLFKVVYPEKVISICQTLKSDLPQLINSIEDFALMIQGLDKANHQDLVKIHTIFQTFQNQFFELLEDYLLGWHDDSMQVINDELGDMITELIERFSVIYTALREGQPSLIKTNFLTDIEELSIAEQIAAIGQHIKENSNSRTHEAWKLAYGTFGQREFDKTNIDKMEEYCQESASPLRSVGPKRKEKITHALSLFKPREDIRGKSSTSLMKPVNP